jgi:cyanophycinase
MAATLMAIGGAMDVTGPGAVLREFYNRAGGPAARIVIIPTASTDRKAAHPYLSGLRRMGLRHRPLVLSIIARSDTQRRSHTTAIRHATGILFGGGNQVRLSATFGGTPLERELRAAYQRGAIVAGSSAGAAILSTVMLAFGRNGPTPRQGIAQFLPGLAFTDRLIFDQHFRQRDRLGRLLYAVANHPGLLGVGVDENTAALIEGDCLTVVGENAVTIVDGADLADTDVAEVDGHRPLAISGARVHVLTHGCTFDLQRRRASIPHAARPTEDQY